MVKFTEHKMTILKGSVGDLVTEWMTDEEAKAFWKDHAIYVEELKAKGEYLQPVELTMKVENDPLYDEIKEDNSPVCESYRLEIIDMSKNNLDGKRHNI
jgi:hypothetical protein